MQNPSPGKYFRAIAIVQGSAREIVVVDELSGEKGCHGFSHANLHILEVWNEVSITTISSNLFSCCMLP
jgi:hypothetical protein